MYSQFPCHVPCSFAFDIAVFPYKVSSVINMEGLRELRGMVVFPAEETTPGILLLFR